MNQKQRWNSTGYDAEEFYFEKLNRELIQRLKSEMTPEKSLNDPQQVESKGATIIAFPTRAVDHKKAA